MAKKKTLELSKLGLLKQIVTYPQGRITRYCFCVVAVLLTLIPILAFIEGLVEGQIKLLILSTILAPMMFMLPYLSYFLFKNIRQGVANSPKSLQNYQDQVAQYSSMPYLKSYRGAAFVATIAILILTIIYSLIISDYEILYDIAIVLPLLFLLHRSYAWVYILCIIWWSFEKILQLYSQISAAPGIIFWWGLVCFVYYRAFKVELARNKLLKAEGTKVSKWKMLRDIVLSIVIFFVLLLIMAYLFPEV